MKTWEKAKLNQNSTIREAIYNLDQSALQIILVVDSHQVLVGIITDGDIRRGLLRGLDMDSPITSVINSNPFVVEPTVHKDNALQIMRTHLIHALPIIDQEKRIVGLHLLEDILALPERSNIIIIMAGGKGSRLYPHTQNCPKPLLPVRGKPILEHIIEHARAEGFSRFILSVHYLAEMIEEYFRDGSRWQVQIEYIREKKPLGTAGAISLLSSVPNTCFLVTNGDILASIRYDEMLDYHQKQNAQATMAVRLYEWQNPFGVVHTEGIDITGFEEKPISRSYINAGIYILEPKALDVLEINQHCDMPTLFERLKNRGDKTIVYPIYESWLDVGRPSDYEAAQLLSN